MAKLEIREEGGQWIARLLDGERAFWEARWQGERPAAWRALLPGLAKAKGEGILHWPEARTEWQVELFKDGLPEDLQERYLAGLAKGPGTVLYWRHFAQGSKVLLSVAVMQLPGFLPLLLGPRLEIRPAVLAKEEIPLGAQALYQGPLLLGLYEGEQSGRPRALLDRLAMAGWDRHLEAPPESEGERRGGQSFGRKRFLAALLAVATAAAAMYGLALRPTEVPDKAEMAGTAAPAATYAYRGLFHAVYGEAREGLRIAKFSAADGRVILEGKTDGQDPLQRFLDELDQRHDVAHTALLQVKPAGDRVAFKLAVEMKGGA